MIGIYKIENLLNHKIYIGQSIHIERRWKEHCISSAHSVIANAIKKYGKENFSFQILEECNIEELDDKERFYIQKFNSVVPNGYNVEEYSASNKTNYIHYDKEVLLSIINDIKENILSFQEISEKYNISKRMVYYLNAGNHHYLQNENYPLREVADTSKKYHYCISCGKEISKNAKRCKECAAEEQRVVSRPEREELKNLIRSNSFVSIGKMYDVSDNAVRKWCKYYNLPFKKTDIKSISEEDWLLL